MLHLPTITELNRTVTEILNAASEMAFHNHNSDLDGLMSPAHAKHQDSLRRIDSVSILPSAQTPTPLRASTTLASAEQEAVDTINRELQKVHLDVRIGSPKLVVPSDPTDPESARIEISWGSFTAKNTSESKVSDLKRWVSGGKNLENPKSDPNPNPNHNPD